MRRRLYTKHSELKLGTAIKLLRAPGKAKLLMSINHSSQSVNPDFLISV